MFSLNLTQQIAYWLIFLEIALGLGAIICIALARLWIDRRRRLRNERRRQLVKIISENLFTDEQFNIRHIRHLLTDPLVVLEVVESFEARVTGSRWEEVRHELLHHILKPQVKKRGQSFWWHNRYIATRILLVGSEKSDEPLIFKLLNDEDFFIRMLIARCAVSIETKTSTFTVLQKMASEPPSCRFPYRYALIQGSLAVHKFIMEIYLETEDPQIKALCLNVMAYRIYTDVLPFLEKDFHSPFSEVRLGIAKILSSNPYSEAFDILMCYIEDEEPAVRAAAATGLGLLQDQRSLPKLAERLHDSDFSTRLQAGIALKKLGQEGLQVLQTQDADINPLAYKIARYVLTRNI